jgi:Phloem protein 2
MLYQLTPLSFTNIIFNYFFFRFQYVAYLQQIWWFEVVGEIDFCFPAGTYSLYFRLHLGRPARRFGRRICTLDHIHGWDVKPARFQLATSDGQQALTQCYLDQPGMWVMHHVGDFVVRKSNEPIKIKFSVAQIDCTHTKGGLCIDSAFIYPKGCLDYREDSVFNTRLWC